MLSTERTKRNVAANMEKEQCMRLGSGGSGADRERVSSLILHYIYLATYSKNAKGTTIVL